MANSTISSPISAKAEEEFLERKKFNFCEVQINNVIHSLNTVIHFHLNFQARLDSALEMAFTATFPIDRKYIE